MAIRARPLAVAGSGGPCHGSVAEFASRMHPQTFRAAGFHWRWRRIKPSGMQAVLERLLGARVAGLAMQFLRFGTVGAAGFVVDTAVVYGLRGTVGIYAAGAAAYVAAASFTWLFNRLWTFRTAPRTNAARQWAVFLATQSLGFVVNRGIFAILVTVSAFCATHPVVAIAAGVAAGMFLNFAAARRYVFAQG